jgi:hypothetical protein
MNFSFHASFFFSFFLSLFFNPQIHPCYYSPGSSSLLLFSFFPLTHLYSFGSYFPLVLLFWFSFSLSIYLFIHLLFILSLVCSASLLLSFYKLIFSFSSLSLIPYKPFPIYLYLPVSYFLSFFLYLSLL